ncbi:methionine adenosyltransferase domain-containing protein [Candidatus Saccharibacteria bacterium]|nr:methionine adenosyltransferase domain-containing protein [Candidatus Saccharibacteria bacterium]
MKTNPPLYRTAESVSPKHPDKLCDQISDAILDAHLAEDPKARVAVDVCGGHGKVFVTGEVTSRAVKVDVEKIVQRIAGPNIEVIENLEKQSPEIAQGVDTGGAGDQGIMIGYACDETLELLPLEYVLARSLCQFIYDKFPYDGKTQITLKNGEVCTIVASFQNVPDTDLMKLVWQWVEQNQLVGDMTAFTNPAGDWRQGGFDADAGLTGRKLAVDNYGPRIAIGGGAFSGKDASKVDRSAAYMARRVAVDYLREVRQNCDHLACKADKFGGQHEVFVRLAYAIGVAEPLERTVIIDGRHEVIDAKYDLTPRGIIKKLDLLKPQYEASAAWGHFGTGFSWDK